MFGLTACGTKNDASAPASDTAASTDTTDSSTTTADTAAVTEESAEIKIGITSQTMKEKTYRDMLAGAEAEAAARKVYME